MNKLACFLVLTAICCSGALAGQAENQEASFSDLRNDLTHCARLYEVESELLDSTYDLEIAKRKSENFLRGAGNWISEADVYRIKSQVFSDSQAKGTEHQQCVKDAKVKMSKNASSFFRHFKPSQQQKAKGALALWLTALGVTGKPNFETELAKFDGAVNDLKIEAMIGAK